MQGADAQEVPTATAAGPASGVPRPRSHPAEPEVAEVAEAAEAVEDLKNSLVNFREMAAYASTFFGLACLVKVYGVSRFSTTTTAALITTAPEQVILGTLAVYVYPTMAILAYGTPWVAFTWRRSVPREAWPFVLAVTTLAAMMTPIEYHGVCLAVLAVSAVIELMIRRLPTADDRSGPLTALQQALRGRTFVFLGGFLLLMGFVNTLDSPWASAEVFVVKEPVVSATQDLNDGADDGPVRWAASSQPFVGYVIDEGDGSFKVLNASTRYIMMLDEAQVVARYTCHSREAQLPGREPILNRLRGQHYQSPNSDCDKLVLALQHDGGPASR